MKGLDWKISNRVSLFIICLSALFSPLLLFTVNTYIGLVVFMVWLVLLSANYRLFTTRSLLAVMAWLGLCIFPLIMGYNYIFNRYIVLSLLVLSPWVNELCYKAKLWEDIRVVIAWLSPFLIYIYVNTFFALLSDSYASRKIKTSGEYTTRARAQGIGGYEYIYFLVLISIVVIGLAFILKNKRKKVLCVGICVLSYIEIVLSNYFTALLLATIGIVLVIIIKLITKRKEWLFFFCEMFVVMLLCGNLILSILLDFLLPFVPQSGKTYMRLLQIQSAPLQGIVNEFVDDRIDTIIMNIDTMIKYPIIGIIGEEGLTQEQFFASVGQHSFWLDTFAIYGIGIGFLVMITFVSTFRKQYFEGNKIIVSLPLFVVFFLLLLLNNATISLGIVLGIIYPYAMHLVDKQNCQI